MIHYHGTPIWPTDAACSLLQARHACVSFASPDQLALAFEVCQSVMIDNGAYSIWKSSGGSIDLPAYAEFVKEWRHHPSFDFYIIPDYIGGTEEDNAIMQGEWQALGMSDPHGDPWGAPVWHMHESLRLLKSYAEAYPRVALGSSGEWPDPGDERWWHRMGEAMNAICIDGRPQVKLHGLRMLDPTIFSHLPLSSADSTNVARSIAHDKEWVGRYTPPTKTQRAHVLAARIEAHCSAARWTRDAYGTQKNLELIG